MRCTCVAHVAPHHHERGKLYGCSGYSHCRRCQEHDERLWEDELRADGRVQRGRAYIRARYGEQTARILYGYRPR